MLRYCTDDPFDPPNQLALKKRLDQDCSWCGYSAGAVDERQKYELYLSTDGGECEWHVSINEGDVIFIKPYEDGNPVGTYDHDEGMTTQHMDIVECGIGFYFERPC